MPSLTAFASLLAFSGGWALPVHASLPGDAPILLAQVEAPIAPERDTGAPVDREPRGEVLTEPPVIEAPIERVQPSTGLSEADKDVIVAEAAAAMAMVKTATGRFAQIAPDFSLTTGSFSLRRPGRMRFEYDDPTPLLIVSDGATVAIEDRDLETIDRVPLASTPLGIVLDDQLDFERDAEVLDVKRADGLAAVTLRDRSGEAEGKVTLIFDAETYDLLSWRAEDAGGGLTSVQLQDVETNVSLNPRLFRLEEPEADRDRRR